MRANWLPALLLMILAQPAAAQTGSTGVKPPAPVILDEVQVVGDQSSSFASRQVQVGTFRDQDPLDVPLTNNVVTREVIDAQGARTLFGALRNTAGVTRSQLGGSTYDNISIRGILVENRGNYRLNGSLPIINLIDIPLENKQRVEVLKGSSSLYYGLVPPSGIVNFVTERAGDTPVTRVGTSVNQHGGADIHADVGRRFADGAMGLRLNAAAGREDIGIDNYRGDRGLVSAAWDWRASQRVSLKLDLEHYRKDVSEQPAIALLPAAAGRIRLPAVPDNRFNLGGSWQRYDAEATNLLLRADVVLATDWALLLEAGRAQTRRDRRFSQFQGYDLATGEGTLRVSFTNGQDFDNTNYRIETIGRIATGPVLHELTIGATYNSRDAYSGDAAPNVDLSQNLFDPRPIEPIDAVFARGTDSSITDKGPYVFDRMMFGERWQLLAGVRYSDYRNVGPTSRYEASKATPNVSILHKLTRDVSLYASYLRGLEETGTAPSNRANNGEILPPAVNRQREVGAKARIAESALMQLALFDIDRPLTTIDAGNRFVIGGRSQYRGVETSISGEIGKRWSLIASALWLDAEIRSVGTGNAGELGKRPENTPRATFSLFSEYRLPQAPGLAVSAGVFHVGKRAVNNLNQAFVGSYTTVSLGTRYRTRLGGKPVTLQANLDNATDRDYWSSAGNGLLGVGLPRTLRLALVVDL